MGDTTKGYWPDEKCDDCGTMGVTYKHWGHLTKGEFKKLCTECIRKRSNKVLAEGQ